MRVGGNLSGTNLFLSQTRQKQYNNLLNTSKQDEEKSLTVSEEMRKMLRSMQQSEETNRRALLEQQSDPLKSNTNPSEEEALLAQAKYNYKDVSGKIQQAKTSASAGAAVIAAKRKVAEIKRKISSGKEDPKELQLALTHARRMEMVARKKKHHLELEELVETTRARDERLNQEEETTSAIQSSIVSLEEENITKAEDEIFEERSELLDEAMETLPSTDESISANMEEELAQLNQMISEFGEEELKELEDAMELLETMEIVDPHMSKEDLEDLKRKHRSNETKAIVKADMDYLKEMIKYISQQGASFSAQPIPTAEAAPVSIDISL